MGPVFMGQQVGGGTTKGAGVWWPLKTYEPCGYGVCFETASFEEERTAEQVNAREKPRIRCLAHLPPGDRVERYEADDESWRGEVSKDGRTWVPLRGDMDTREFNHWRKR